MQADASNTDKRWASRPLHRTCRVLQRANEGRAIRASAPSVESNKTLRGDMGQEFG